MRVNYRVCESGERNVCVLCVDDRRKIAAHRSLLIAKLDIRFFRVANESERNLVG